MPIYFERPVGASADVSELEYISALHQTCDKQVRQDCSITAADIAVFLRSRYGVLVDEEEVMGTIIAGLGGGDHNNEIIDLMEIVSIQLIPTILKSAQQLVVPSASSETASESRAATHPSSSQTDSLVQPEPDLLKRVLTMMLEDVTGDATPKQLNKELLTKIFRAYGEMDLAEDEALQEQMIAAAGQEQPLLDLATFARVLTYDIEEYDVRNELRCTTNFDDVLLIQAGKDLESKRRFDISRELTLEDVKEKKEKAAPMLTEWTAQAIDSTAGNYRNKLLIVMLSSTVMITYFAYWFRFTTFKIDGGCAEYVYDYSSPWLTNSATVACETGMSVVSWLATFFIFSLFGLVFIGLGSLGNGVESRSPWGPVFGFLSVFSAVVPVYFIQEDVRGKYYLDNTSLLFGGFVMLLHLFNLVVLYFRPETLTKYPFIKRIVRSSRLIDQKHLKKAAQTKTNLMVKHALDVLDNTQRENILGSHFGRGLHNFAANVDTMEPSGGFKWTWRKIMDNSVFSEHGIWFSDRLLSGNIAQYIVCIYVLIAGIQFTKMALENFTEENTKQAFSDYSGYFFNTSNDEGIVDHFMANLIGILGIYINNEIGKCSGAGNVSLDIVQALCQSSTGNISCDQNTTTDFLCSFVSAATDDQSRYQLAEQLALLAASGFDVVGVEEAVQIALDEAAETSIESLYPSSEYMIQYPLILGTIVAFLTSVYLAATFLPSITATLLQLRSGVIPTLKYNDFDKYRRAPDQVSILTGSMFWGCLLSSVLVGAFVGLLLFLCLWQVTVYFVQRVIAFIIGVLVVAIIRVCMLTICRCIMYRAMYRQRPFSANLALLALEWANFPLSVAFILTRMIKLVIAACLFIGRIDTPFLAARVGQLGGFELDNYPTVFMKDLLQHEAHRHPYIETIGVMYLMKLRYRDHFGLRAGSIWRLLFVYVLMPWMHKYRIHVGDNVGFLLQEIVQVTGGRYSIVMKQSTKRLLLETDENSAMDDPEEGSQMIIHELSTNNPLSGYLERDNQELRIQVENLLKQEDILRTEIRRLEGQQGEEIVLQDSSVENATDKKLDDK